MIFVLQRKLAALKAVGRSASEHYPPHSRTLQLFMDVLQEASQLLLPDSTEVIALYDLYTHDQCELFRELWGPVGPLCTPYTISPIDRPLMQLYQARPVQGLGCCCAGSRAAV